MENTLILYWYLETSSPSIPSLFVGEGNDDGSGSLQEMNSKGEVIFNYPIKHEVNSLVEWRGYLVSGCRVKGEGGNWSGNITVWDTKSRSIVTQWNTESPVYSLLSLKKKIINGEEDDYLCSGHDDGIINIWNSKGSLIRQLKGHTNTVTSLVMQGEHLISGSYDKTLRKWDLNTGQCLQILEGHTDYVNCVIESHGILFSGSDDKTIRVWNQSGKCIQTIQADD